MTGFADSGVRHRLAFGVYSDNRPTLASCRFHTVTTIPGWFRRKDLTMRRLLGGWNGKRLAIALNLLLIGALALAGAPARFARAQTAPGGGNGPAPTPISGSLRLASGGATRTLNVSAAGTFDPASPAPHAAAPLAPGAAPKPQAIPLRPLVA